MKDAMLSIVLIAKKNTSLCFRRAVESALAQTYPEKELLIVDANEPGDPYSLGLAEDLALYPEAEVLRPGEIGTECALRNLALKRIKGAYVAFMDGKDLWAPGKAALQIEQLKADETAAASCSNGCLRYDEPGAVTTETIFERISWDRRRWLLEKPVRMGSQLVYRTEALRASGSFDEQFDCYGDLDWALRQPEDRKILFFPIVLFETDLPSGKDDRLRRYEGGRLLMRKHADLFLIYHAAAYDYCLGLAKEAGESRLLVQSVAHVAEAVRNMPVYAVVRMISATFRRCVGAVRLTFRYVRALFQAEKLKGTQHRQNVAGAFAEALEAGAVQPELTDAGPEAWPTVAAEEFARSTAFRFAGNRMRGFIIPDSVTAVKMGMFFGCEQLVSVVIPSTVTKIEARAFQNCRSLRNVVFQPGSRLTELGAYAFAGCVSLRGVCLPDSLAKIGKGVFVGCRKLRDLEFTRFDGASESSETNFPNSLTSIPKYAFAGCLSFRELITDEGSMLERIDDAAFLNCPELETVSVSGAVSRIGSWAFSGCVSLSRFEMPLLDAVPFIGKCAFEYCAALPEVQIPFVLKRICARTYYGCASVRTLRIPAGVLSIDRQAFGNCTALKNAVLMNADTLYTPSSFPRETQIDKYRSGPGKRA